MQVYEEAGSSAICIREDRAVLHSESSQNVEPPRTQCLSCCSLVRIGSYRPRCGSGWCRQRSQLRAREWLDCFGTRCRAQWPPSRYLPRRAGYRPFANARSARRSSQRHSASRRRLRADGVEVNPEDVARLSPLTHEHINMLGCYHFTLAEPIARGELRPLRDPNDPTEQEFAA